MLTIYRRHRKNCKQRHDGRGYRRCFCPIWVDRLLNGVEIRKSLKTRDWQGAHQLVRLCEADGRREERPKPIGVKDACDKFIFDAEARGLREPTVYKYRLLFRQLKDLLRYVRPRSTEPRDPIHIKFNHRSKAVLRTSQHERNWRPFGPSFVSYTKVVGLDESGQSVEAAEEISVADRLSKPDRRGRGQRLS
jgi:hypothetical protein